MVRRLLGALAALAFACPAFAFGPRGHEVVAEIASRQLSPAARAEVERLLGDRASNAMRQWSGWPDDVREWPGYGSTASLHYLNFPVNQCTYVPRRDCRNGKCVVAALERFIATAADRTQPDARRADALKWVIHLVADVHMPLHAGWGHDRGGNDVQVQFRGQGMNLHKLWDSGLINTRRLRAVPYSDELLARPRQAFDTGWRAGSATRWAEESCRIVRDGAIYPEHPRIDGGYLDRNRPVVERRLLEAGTRLAAVLNTTLDPAAAR
jgi:hypothetical protein